MKARDVFDQVGFALDRCSLQQSTVPWRDVETLVELQAGPDVGVAGHDVTYSTEVDGTRIEVRYRTTPF